MKKNQYKFLQILFYLVIIVTFIFIRFSGKKITFKTEDNKIKPVVVSKNTSDKEKALENENTSSEGMNQGQDKEEKLSSNQDYLERIDTDLYQENTTREIYGDEVILTFRLTNGDFLYSKQNLPLEIFEYMLEEYQIFFNDIVADIPVKEVNIIEDTFIQTKENISYEIETNLKDKILVTVDLKNFGYQFTIL